MPPGDTPSCHRAEQIQSLAPKPQAQSDGQDLPHPRLRGDSQRVLGVPRTRAWDESLAALGAVGREAAAAHVPTKGRRVTEWRGRPPERPAEEAASGQGVRTQDEPRPHGSCHGDLCFLLTTIVLSPGFGKNSKEGPLQPTSCSPPGAHPAAAPRHVFRHKSVERSQDVLPEGCRQARQWRGGPLAASSGHRGPSSEHSTWAPETSAWLGTPQSRSRCKEVAGPPPLWKDERPVFKDSKNIPRRLPNAREL